MRPKQFSSVSLCTPVIAMAAEARWREPGKLGKNRPRCKVLAAVALLLACVQIQAGFMLPLRRSPLATSSRGQNVVQRRFFGNPMEGVLRDNFVGNVFEEYLPLYTKNQVGLVVIDVEPVDARYWSYLKRSTSKGYPDVIVAVGKVIDELSQETLRSMQDTADGMLARRVEYMAWRQTKWGFGIEDGTVDIAMFSDGAISRLGRKRLVPAMKNVRKALKKRGRVLFVANEEDEKVLGAAMDIGVGDEAVGKFGFNLFASKRQYGVVVGQLRKKGVELLESKSDGKEATSGPKGFVDREGSSRPKALQGVRPVPRRR